MKDSIFTIHFYNPYNNPAHRHHPMGFYINKKLFKEVCEMTYKEQKQKAREEAIEWQRDFENHNYDWLELANLGNYFTKLGKRYGLLKEFRENGIC